MVDYDLPGFDPRNESPLAALRREAVAAGDQEQVEICDNASLGDDAAIAECERIIEAAGVVADSEPEPSDEEEMAMWRAGLRRWYGH
jgi:hypothetical protein